MLTEYILYSIFLFSCFYMVHTGATSKFLLSGFYMIHANATSNLTTRCIEGVFLKMNVNNSKQYVFQNKFISESELRQWRISQRGMIYAHDVT